MTRWTTFIPVCPSRRSTGNAARRIQYEANAVNGDGEEHGRVLPGAIGARDEHHHGRGGAGAGQHGDGEREDGRIVPVDALGFLLGRGALARALRAQHVHRQQEQQHAAGDAEGPQRDPQQLEDEAAQRGERPPAPPPWRAPCAGQSAASARGRLSAVMRQEQRHRGERIDHEEQGRQGGEGEGEDGSHGCGIMPHRRRMAGRIFQGEGERSSARGPHPTLSRRRERANIWLGAGTVFRSEPLRGPRPVARSPSPRGPPRGERGASRRGSRPGGFSAPTRLVHRSRNIVKAAPTILRPRFVAPPLNTSSIRGRRASRGTQACRRNP